MRIIHWIHRLIHNPVCNNILNQAAPFINGELGHFITQDLPAIWFSIMGIAQAASHHH